MLKRDQSKAFAASGGAATPGPKRGRPFGTTGSAAAAAAAADSAAPSNLLGPSLQVYSSFAGQSPTNPRSFSTTVFPQFCFCSKAPFGCALNLLSVGIYASFFYSFFSQIVIVSCNCSYFVGNK